VALIQGELDRVNKKFARVEQVKKFWLLDQQAHRRGRGTDPDDET
jgi:hypothetical protein